jgi:hypothetical protein
MTKIEKETLEIVNTYFMSILLSSTQFNSEDGGRSGFWMVGNLFVSGLGWVLFGRDLQHTKHPKQLSTCLIADVIYFILREYDRMEGVSV